MTEFFEVKCLSEKDVKKLREEVEKRVQMKIKEGVYSEREIREIEEMRLHPLPDIQDVQSVYEDHLFRKKE